MDSIKLIKELSERPFIRSNIAMQTQLGLPYLEKKNNRLCMSFKPHREIYTDNGIEVYTQLYELELVYPFERVIKFVNLTYEREIDTSSPVCLIKSDYMSRFGKFALNELYDACSRVLTFMEKEGRVSDVSITNYRKIYQKTVSTLGLSGLYGDGENDLYSGI